MTRKGRTVSPFSEASDERGGMFDHKPVHKSVQSAGYFPNMYLLYITSWKLPYTLISLLSQSSNLTTPAASQYV